jgi:creatinine amidohydrolase
MEVLWANLTWPEIKEATIDDAIVLIPVGSMEQHGQHLPISTDSINCFEIVQRAAQKVSDKVKVLVTPALWAGYSAHHMNFPGTISLEVNTLSTVVFQICKCIYAHGFKRIVLVNGHGGNNSALQVASQEIGEKLHFPAVVIKLLDLLKDHIQEVRRSRPSAYRSHAGELETSLQLVFSPSLIKKNKFRKVDTYPSSEYKGKFFVYDGNWEVMTATGGVGDPSLASKDKGEKLIDIAVSELANFLTEFRTWDLMGFWPPQTRKLDNTTSTE